MELHDHKTNRGEILAQGKVARIEAFPCGHIVVTLDTFKIGFASEDFRDFAHSIALSLEHLQNREIERTEWGLFM